ncbi:putative D-xylose reductase [Russula brevipes]|nr:putative D-xylose reductase [Russula brevipes]
MASIVLKRTGHKMPLVGFGLWKAVHRSQGTAALIVQCHQGGYRLFDGAGDYGNEKEAGEGVRRALSDGIIKREELFITSKVKAATKMQLELWGLEYFDLFLVHFPIALEYVDPNHRYPPEWWGDDKKSVNLQNTPFQETWGVMEELVDDGLVRISASGWYINTTWMFAADMAASSNVAGALLVDILSYARIQPQVLQVELHPYLTQEPLLRLTKTLGIAVTAYSSFGPQSYLELGFKGVTCTKDGEDPAQVLLRWATQRGIAVIPKTNAADRLLSNLDCTSFDLTGSEIEAISALNIDLRLNNPADIDPRLAIFA